MPKILKISRISKIKKKLIFKIFIFLWKFWDKKCWKIFFEMLSHQDEKIFLVQIFFYCLDYASRPLKNCSEYSGNLKHASAVDSVSKLSLKNDRKPMNFSWKSCFMTIGFVRKSLVNREFCPFSERLCRLAVNWSHGCKSLITNIFCFPNMI